LNRSIIQPPLLHAAKKIQAQPAFGHKNELTFSKIVS
jgi:hypothetical protein